jgi:hypothetical protein
VATEHASVLPRPWALTAIIILLLPHLVGLLGLFPYHAFTVGDVGLSIFAVGSAVVTLLTLAGLWLGKSWALWATLIVVTFKATIDLFAWAIDLDRIGPPIGAVVLLIITILVFRQAVPPTPRVTAYQRALFACVLAFAAWVAVWGLVVPAQIGSKLPLTVPPLHARFLGAMYLSGSVFMALGMLATDWHEVRVVTLILALWTGMLGAVSVLNLSVFNWAHGPTWFWFIAYIGFPLIALWVIWCQRSETSHPADRPISQALRAYLLLQGAVATALALALLLMPQLMTTVWPWSIPVLVAQIYSAPFLAYGLGSLYAARQQAWTEVRIPVLGTLVFVLGVLAASLLHRGVFNPTAPSVWLWFGGFAIAGLALLMFAVVPPLRTQAKS